MPQDAGLPDPTPDTPNSRADVNPVAGRIDPLVYYAEPTPPRGLTAGPDLSALLRSLRRRWMAAVAFGLPLAFFAAAAAWFLMSPKYTGFAQFRVLAVQSSPFGNKDARYDFPTYIRTLAAQLKSRPVILGALKRDEVKRLGLESRVSDPAQYIEEELKPEFTDQSEMLIVTMSSNDPTEAVSIIKAVANEFMEQIVYADGRERAKHLKDLEAIYDKADDGLRKKKADLKNLAKSLGTTDKDTLTQQQIQILDAERDARNSRNQAATELFRTQALLDAHKTRLEALKHAPVAAPDLESALDLDAEYKQFTARLKVMETLISDLGEESREPTAIVAREKRVELKRKIEQRKGEVETKIKNRTEKRDLAEVELVRVQLEKQVVLLKDELDRREGELKELMNKAAQIGSSTNDLDALKDVVKREQQTVNELGAQLDRLRIEIASNPPRVSLYQEADLQKKDAKKQILATVASPIGVLFAVCMGLAWSEYKQRRVRCAGDVADGLGMRVVGAVPNLRHAERHLVGPNGEPAIEAYPVLESFDAIRTQLLHDARAGTTRVVQVTSAVAGEGKTTLACHLATSLARAGRKTLLIDGDLRRPAVHQLFELPLQPGLSEVLLGEVEVAEGVQQTTLAGLSVMPAGQWDREVLQALARDGLEGVFERLQEEFDFIIVDSHPILPAADALLLARHADAVILSVLREVSQTPRLYAANRRLEAVGARVLGAVVNAAAPDEAYANPALAQPAA